MKFILLSISLLVSTNLYAQNKSRTILSFDFGLSSSKDVSFTSSYNDERRLYAPGLGLNVNFPIKGAEWFTTGINYYQIGDMYNYYTGRNYNRTDVKIFVNILKIPVFYSVFFEKGKKVNIFIKAGPSLDFIIGESVIKPEKSLNNPDGFRGNVSQGTVRKKLFIPLNFGTGLSFKNKSGILSSYLEFLFYGRIRDIYDDSTGSKSSYNNISLKFGMFFISK